MTFIEKKALELDQKTELLARELKQIKDRFLKNCRYHGKYGADDFDIWYIGSLARDYEDAKAKWERLVDEERMLNEFRKGMSA